MRYNKNNKELTLIQSDKGQPTSPSSFLTTTGGKGNHRRNSSNQGKNEKGKKTTEGKEQQNKWMQVKTPPRKTTKTTNSRSGTVNLRVTNNFRKSDGSKKK